MNIFWTNNFWTGLFIIMNYSIIWSLTIIWTMTNIPTAIFQMGIFQRLYCNRVYEMFMFRTGIFQRLYFKWLFETTIFQTVISKRLYFKRQCLSSLYIQAHSPYSAKSQSLRCCFLTSKWGRGSKWALGWSCPNAYSLCPRKKLQLSRSSNFNFNQIYTKYYYYLYRKFFSLQNKYY